MPLVLVGMQRYSDIDANAATRPTRWRFLVAGMKWSRTFSWASYMRCSPWPPRTRTTLCAVMVVHGGSGGTRTVVSGCYAWSVRPFAIELRRHVCKTRVLKLVWTWTIHLASLGTWKSGFINTWTYLRTRDKFKDPQWILLIKILSYSSSPTETSTLTSSRLVLRLKF
jgi:hypothetical protein